MMLDMKEEEFKTESNDQGKKYNKHQRYNEQLAFTLSERIQEKKLRQMNYLTMRSCAMIAILLAVVIFILFLRTELLVARGLDFWNASNINSPSVVSNYSYHAILAVCGFYLCQVVVTVIYSLFPDKEDSTSNFIVHAFFGTAGVICLSLSLVAACRYKDFNLQPHLVSSHAWIGILAIVLYYYNWLNGVLMSFFRKSTIWDHRHHLIVAIMSLYATSVSISTGISSSNSFCFQQGFGNQFLDTLVNFYCRANNTVSLLTATVFFTAIAALIVHNSQKQREDLRSQSSEPSSVIDNSEYAQAQGTSSIL